MFIVTKADISTLTSIETNDLLTECAAKIAIRNFEWSYTTLLLFNSTIISGVDLFLKLYKKTQIIGKGIFYPPFAQKTKQYIVFGEDLMDIQQMLAWMEYQQFDNTGKYIVTCQSLISQRCDENKAVEVFWSHRITKVVFFKVYNGSAVGFTYFYPSDNCAYSKAVRIDICENDDSIDDLFPKKLINLRSCPITVSTFIQKPYMNITDGVPTGSDGDLLRLIGEKLNCNLNVITPRHGEGWGKIDQDGEWSGSMRDVLDNVANFSMTSAAITVSRYSHFQMSVGYYTVNVAWVTHPSAVVPASLKLSYPLATSTQIVLAFSFVIVCFCAWFVNSKHWPFRRNEDRKHSVLFYSWMVCMGLPSTKLPAKPVFIYMLSIWIWYCFLIRTFYQVYLINFLQGTFYYDEIDTIEEAYDSDYTFGGGSALRDYYIDDPLVYDNWKNINTAEIVPTLLNLSNKKFVLAMNLETIRNFIKKQKLAVHILPQKVINSPTVIFFKKFSPLAESVNIILWRLVESGFTEKFYKNYASKSRSREERGVRPITLEHYTGCYVIIVLGWFVSSMIFVVELLYSKLKPQTYT